MLYDDTSIWKIVCQVTGEDGCCLATICVLQQCMVVTISFGGFVADQMQYNLERAQYP